MKWISCDYCNKQVSCPVPASMQIRAWVLCRDCVQSNPLMKTLSDLRKAIIDAAVEADWCHPGLGEAIHQAELLLPKHLR